MAVNNIIAGTPAYANNAAPAPVNPSHVAGDLLVCFVFFRGTGAVTTATSGWSLDTTLSPTNGGCRVFTNYADSSSEADPSFSYSGGGSNQTAAAVIIRLRGAATSAALSFGTVGNNASAQNIAFPNTSPSIAVGDAILAVGCKLDDNANPGMAVISGTTAGVTFSELVEGSSTLGSDISFVVDSGINSGASAYTAGTGGSVTVTGGGSAVSFAFYVHVAQLITLQTLDWNVGGGSVDENSASNTVVGNVANTKTTGSTISMLDDDGGRFTLALGTSIRTTALVLDYETDGPTRSITLRETLTGASNTPNDTVLTVTVNDVSEGGSTSIVAAAGAYAYTGTAAGLLEAKKVAATPGSYALTGTVVSFARGRSMAAAPGSYALTGAAAGLLEAKRIVAAPGSYALTGTAASLERGLSVAAVPGSYALAGTTVALRAARKAVATPGTYALTGAAAGLKAARLIAAAPGAYSLAGASVEFRKGINMPAATGSYSLTGTAATFARAWRLTSVPGAYSLVGTAAQFIRPGRLEAGAGSYAYVGTAAVFSAARKIGAVPGAYTYTGTAVNFALGIRLSANAGAYAYTGTAALFFAGRRLAAAPGAYAYAGTAVSLAYAPTEAVLAADAGAYGLTGTAAGLRAGRALVVTSGLYRMRVHVDVPPSRRASVTARQSSVGIARANESAVAGSSRVTIIPRRIA
jgi:hypothetical protein